MLIGRFLRCYRTSEAKLQRHSIPLPPPPRYLPVFLLSPTQQKGYASVIMGSKKGRLVSSLFSLFSRLSHAGHAKRGKRRRRKHMKN